MEFKICNNCNMIFQYMGSGDIVCPDCIRKEEEDMESIRSYLIEHPGAKEKEISQNTGVSTASITKYYQKLRASKKSSSSTLTCVMCGLSIPSGKYCADCTRKISREAGALGNNRISEGMRFIRR